MTLLDQLRAAEELQKRATAGPWWRTDPPWGDGTTVHAGRSDDPHLARAWICQDTCADKTGNVQDDMEFIATVRNLPLAAIRERLEGLEQRVTELEEACLVASTGLEVLVSSDADQRIVDISPVLRCYLRNGLEAIRAVIVGKKAALSPGEQR